MVAPGARYGLHIFGQHAGLLAASAITPEVARERGYVSVGEMTRLEPAGFARAQRSAPGLLIPVHGTDGTVRLHQYRPDSPRKIAGKPVRYETPAGRRLCLDVPPRARPGLADPGVPLWITEGARKSDAAVSAGLCCIALLGVGSWRALPDWDDIRLKGREVLVCFDSDVMTKPAVADELAKLTGWLDYRGARVRHVILPEGKGGSKTGLDDYLSAGHTVAELEALASAPAAAAPELEPVTWDGDAAGLLDDVAGFLRSYVAFPSAHAAVAVALWAAHTHLAACFESTPRLALLSPEKQCGKSRVLELLELLCAGAETLSDASPAYLYRRIDAGEVTILLDEGDAIWRRGKSDEAAEALRSIVNSGHRKSATVGRVEMNASGGKLTRFKVFAPAAIAAIGSLPDTILDRAVIVRMRRRAPDEPVRDYRERVTRPEGAALRSRLRAWAAVAAEGVGDPWPDLPQGVADRAADVWEPLVMLADLAGGDWPKLAREACTASVTGARDDTETVSARLLADLRSVWCGTSGTSGTALARQVPQVPEVPAVATEELLRRLHGIDEAPWGDWYGHPLTARDLARLLHPYDIASTKVKIEGQSVRGYRSEDLWQAWRRYLPPPDCTECGQPLDPALIAAGFTTHGEETAQ